MWLCHFERQKKKKNNNALNMSLCNALIQNGGQNCVFGFQHRIITVKSKFFKLLKNML